jgi:hypothetical protein
MPIRLAVIGRDLVSQADSYRRFYSTWVTGARRTLEVELDTDRRIINWIRRTTLELSPPVDLDLIAHGGGGRLGGSGDVIYVVRLGSPGIYSVNVHHWRDLAGLIRKIRVYSCGVASAAFPAGTFSSSSAASQHQLMTMLASNTNATVKYSLNTLVGTVTPRELSQSFDADRMSSPVFIVEPSGGRRRLR